MDERYKIFSDEEKHGITDVFSGEETFTQNGKQVLVSPYKIVADYILNDTVNANSNISHCTEGSIKMVSTVQDDKNNYPLCVGSYDYEFLIDRLNFLKEETDRLVLQQENKGFDQDRFNKLQEEYILLESNKGKINSFAKNNEVIQSIKKAYKECTSSYFYIPIILVPLTSEPDVLYHSNGILINKNKGTFTRIEPEQLRVEDELQQKYINLINFKIDKSIKIFVSENLLTTPKENPLLSICPQSLLNDNNCLFWSLFITNEILRNTNKYNDPNDVIKSLYINEKEYMSLPEDQKEKSRQTVMNEWRVIIENFKLKLVTEYLPKALAQGGYKMPKSIESDFESIKGKKLIPINMSAPPGHRLDPVQSVAAKYLAAIGKGRRTRRKKYKLIKSRHHTRVRK